MTRPPMATPRAGHPTTLAGQIFVCLYLHIRGKHFILFQLPGVLTVFFYISRYYRLQCIGHWICKCQLLIVNIQTSTCLQTRYTCVSSMTWQEARHSYSEKCDRTSGYTLLKLQYDYNIFRNKYVFHDQYLDMYSSFLAVKAAPISRNVCQLVSQSVSQSVSLTN